MIRLVIGSGGEELLEVVEVAEDGAHRHISSLCDLGGTGPEVAFAEQLENRFDN